MKRGCTQMDANSGGNTNWLATSAVLMLARFAGDTLR